MSTMGYVSGAWRVPSYVTINAEGRLSAEQLHAAIVAPNVHDPINHTGLLVADPHPPSIHTNDRHADVVRRIWTPAELWFPSVVAAGAMINVVDTPCYNMPDGAAEQIVAFMRTPVGTDEATIQLRLLMATDVNNIGAGDVTIVSEMTGYNAGDAISAAGGGVSQDIPFPLSGAGISLMVISPVLDTTPIVGPFEYYALAITRRGDLPGTDTYVGDCNIIAMEVAFDFEN